MRDRERTVVAALVVLMLTVWLGFLLHRSPRFAGSLWGGALGVSGAILMLVPLFYVGVKHVPIIKRRVTGWMSMRTLLTVHIYTALIGAILVLLHTGHKFDSPLGMALTATVLLVVLSGVVGRYLMSHINRGLREKQEMRRRLEIGFERMRDDLAHQTVEHASTRSSLRQGLAPWNWFGGMSQTGEIDSVWSLNAVAGAIADLEYSIAVHVGVKKLFLTWLRLHRVISTILYVLLAMHVWSGIHYGLRWFQ